MNVTTILMKRSRILSLGWEAGTLRRSSSPYRMSLGDHYLVYSMFLTRFVIKRPAKTKWLYAHMFVVLFTGG